MRFNFITALLFATALAQAAPVPASTADATAIAGTDDYDDQDLGLEARDGVLSELENFENKPTPTDQLYD
ncbi:hypothetical protein RUND412_010978, partial [Rhizina undulata]